MEGDDAETAANLAEALEELKKTCCSVSRPSENVINLHPPSVRLEMISRIEDLTEGLLQKISEEEPACPDGPTLRPPFLRDEAGAPLHLLVHMLARIHRLLITDSCSTRRELYYEDAELMTRQSRVDKLVHKISCLLQAPQWLFNVFTTSKGLVYGNLTIHTRHHSIDCSVKPGVLVPQDLLDVRLESTAKFILVVEKDTIFQKLLDEDFPTKTGPCILITGKGVPDVNTRYLVKRASEQLALPLLGLFDADPYGVEIMSVYRFGSTAMSHLKEELCVDGLRWLGLHPTDLTRFSVATLPLTERDRSRAISLLSRPQFRRHPRILAQVSEMIESGLKAELEGVFSVSSRFLSDVYLPMKIACREYF